jgi:hypothetical protein
MDGFSVVADEGAETDTGDCVPNAYNSGCTYPDAGNCPTTLPWTCYGSDSPLNCWSSDPDYDDAGEAFDAGEAGGCSGLSYCCFEGRGPSSCPDGQTVVCCASEDPASCHCQASANPEERCYAVGFPTNPNC